MKLSTYVIRRTIIFSLVLIMGFFGLKQIYKCIFAINSISIVFDSALSEEAKQSINVFVRDLHSHLIKPQDIIQKLKNEFSYIQLVVLKVDSKHAMYLSITVHQPIFFINDSFVLTKNGLLINPQIFNSTVCAELPNIIVDQKVVEDRVSQTLRDFLDKLSPKIISRFQVCWLHDHEVLLNDRHCTNFTIRMNSTDLLSDALLSSCEHIKLELEKRGMFTIKKRWIADVRFEKQIVLSEDRGEYYGKNIF